MSGKANRLTPDEVLDVLGISYTKFQPSDNVEYRIRRDDLATAFPNVLDENMALRALQTELKSEGWIGFWGARTDDTVMLVVKDAAGVK